MSAALMPVFSGWDSSMIGDRTAGGKARRIAAELNAGKARGVQLKIFVALGPGAPYPAWRRSRGTTPLTPIDRKDALGDSPAGGFFLCHRQRALLWTIGATG